MNQGLRINKKKLGGLLLLLIILGIASFFVWQSKVIAPSPLSTPNNDLPIAETRLPKTKIIAVGDVMLSRNIGTAIDKINDPNLPFAETRDLLAAADITFGNLECPLSDSDIPIREGLIFRCLTKYVPGLLYAGFDVLSTANNHSFDQGQDNIGFTIDHLLAQNILPVGTGNNYEETHAGRIVTRDDIKFGFLGHSYSAHNDGGNSSHPQIATMDDLAILKSDILNLKSRSDVIIVSMHAGTEYTRHPSKFQTDFAHAAIDAGADVVIGHHPHWIQDIEIYKGRPIFYSLGNFVFDQSWSQDTREGLAIELTYEQSTLTQAKLIPVVIENNCCPKLATEKEKEVILEKINRESDTITFDKLPASGQE